MSPDENLTLATRLELRMEAIYSSKAAGIEYYVALLLQTFVPALQYARKNPSCQLYDIYHAGLAPEQQEPRFAIENNTKFLDTLRSAISDASGTVASAAVRFVRKVLRAKISSIRYLNQHATAMVAAAPDTLDHQLVVSCVGHTLLGSVPHATVIAPPKIIVDFFDDPVGSTIKTITIAGSRGLYSLLSEFISEISNRYPDLWSLMSRGSGRLPNPSDKWLRAADSAVRPAVITNFEGNTTPGSRRQLKNVPQPPIIETCATKTYVAERASRGVKRKLGATVYAKIPPEVVSELYKTAIARIPRKPRLPVGLIDECVVKFGVDRSTVMTTFLHAIEQRGGFSLTRTSRAVAKAQRKAHGGPCPVKICVWCHSLRTYQPRSPTLRRDHR